MQISEESSRKKAQIDQSPELGACLAYLRNNMNPMRLDLGGVESGMRVLIGVSGIVDPWATVRIFGFKSE